MKYHLDDETGFFTGYWATDDKDLKAVDELPVGAKDITQWRDEDGNPLWIMKGNTVVAAPVRPLPPEVIAKKKAAALLAQVPQMLLDAVKSTDGENKSWAAFDSAVRSLLNGN